MNPSDWPRLDGIPEGVLSLWTMYDHPLDYPDFWVVRRCFGCKWEAGMPGLDAGGVTHDVVPRLARSLAEARELVPLGLYRQPRSPGDDLTIVESWF